MSRQPAPWVPELPDDVSHGAGWLDHGFQIAAQGGITYNVTGNSAGETVYNTMSTPKGRQFHVMLPDGTQVWLNAASSIRYPTTFTGKAREVDVQGEAYFEVAKNESVPFRVRVNNAIIEVLGTHFNVTAYSDESFIKTTLLEGSIRFTKGPESRLLKPGQQVLFLEENNTISLVGNADLEQVVAWKNGNFDFSGQNIEAVMNQVGRWYNMEIIYEGKKPEAKIQGITGREMSLITLLNSLELTSGIKFRIESSDSDGQAGKIFVQQ